MRLLLVAVLLASGCRDYDALSRGRDLSVGDLGAGDLGGTDLGAGDLGALDGSGSDLAPGHCGPIDLALNGSTAMPLYGPFDVSATSDWPMGLAAGDFNSDQLPDLVVTVPGQNLDQKQIQVFSAPSFTSSTGTATFGVPMNVAAADLDGDGNRDVVTVDDWGASLTILPGTLTGGFGTAIKVPLSAAATATVANDPPYVVTADFNGDGLLDLAASVPSIDEVVVLLAEPGKAFTYQTTTPEVIRLAAGSRPGFLLTTDLDGNCTADLAVADYGTGLVTVFLGSGTGTFSFVPSFTVGGQPTALAAADFDRDGRVDLAVANSSSSFVSILYGAPSGVFSPARSLALPQPSNSSDVPVASMLTAADLNGDGALDLAVADDGAFRLVPFFNDGRGNFTPSAEVALDAARNLIAVDLGDGKPILVYTRGNAAELRYSHQL